MMLLTIVALLPCLVAIQGKANDWSVVDVNSTEAQALLIPIEQRLNEVSGHSQYFSVAKIVHLIKKISEGTRYTVRFDTYETKCQKDQPDVSTCPPMTSGMSHSCSAQLQKSLVGDFTFIWDPSCFLNSKNLDQVNVTSPEASAVLAHIQNILIKENPFGTNKYIKVQGFFTFHQRLEGGDIMYHVGGLAMGETDCDKDVADASSCKTKKGGRSLGCDVEVYKSSFGDLTITQKSCRDRFVTHPSMN